MGDGHLGKCTECTKDDVKENRIKRGDYYNEFDQNRYRSNIERLLKLKYSGMRRRILGLNKHSNLVGLELMPLKEFLDWTEKTKKQFMKLFRQWKTAGYPRKLSPSVDRINNKIGYVAGNLQWLTQQQNAKKFTH
jgi:hypothetical protein